MDRAGFDTAMAEQRRAPPARRGKGLGRGKASGRAWYDQADEPAAPSSPATELGTEGEGRVRRSSRTAQKVEKAGAGDVVTILTNQTPF